MGTSIAAPGLHLSRRERSDRLGDRVRGFGLSIAWSPSPAPSARPLPPGEVNAWLSSIFKIDTVRVSLTFLRLAREAFEQALDLAVLLTLAVGPFPDHLLFGAHMRNQSLD